MKIVFLYPSWSDAYGIFGYFARRNSSWPTMSFALLGAIAEKSGHEAFIIDGQLEGLDVDRLVDRALALEPDIIGLTATSPYFHFQKEAAEKLKEKRTDLPIMIGGPHISIVKEEALLPCFDYAFVGDAEESFEIFLRCLESGGDISEVKGIIHRENGEPRFTGPAPWISDVNALPTPDRDLLKMDMYRIGTPRGRMKFTTVYGSRGCPWKCIFCASEALNTTRVLRKDPELLVAEMAEIVSRYGTTHFMFIDDVLTLDRDYSMTVCDLIEEHKLSITFEGSTRANLIDEELIERMSKCGLVRMSFGVETVNTEMRQTMKKKVPMKYYIEANRILNKFNVEAHNTLMIGLPGETRETVTETLNFLRNSKEVKQANLAITVPYPGTELHEMAIGGRHGIKLLTNDFSEYRRYGTAVTEVGDLSPKDLIDLQNEGFISIYSAPWRWKAMWAKHGLMGVLLLFIRVGRLISQRFGDNFRSMLGIGGDDSSSGLPAGHHGAPNSPNG